jgi:DNA-binding beta-propeller fold protein YncE
MRGSVLLAAALLAGTGSTAAAADGRFELAGVGGFVMTPDNVTLIVSETSKTRLVYFDTVAGKETKKVSVDFQPTRLAISGNTLFVAQKGGGVVHILDADSGKEVKNAKTGGPVKDIAALSSKPIAFATNSNREVYRIDSKGAATKLQGVQGDFVTVDPAGAFICTTVLGRVRADLFKYTIDGKDLKQSDDLQRPAVNPKGVLISPDGQQVAVLAGGGYDEAGSRRRHYAVPIYSTSELKTMLGEMETGPFPSAIAYHPTQPLAAAVKGDGGSLFDTKSFAAKKKLQAPKAGEPTVLAFGGNGKKLIYGTTNGDVTILAFQDLADD